MDSKLARFLARLTETAELIIRLDKAEGRASREELYVTIIDVGREAGELLRALRATAPAALVGSGLRSDVCPDADWRDGAEGGR